MPMSQKTLKKRIMFISIAVMAFIAILVCVFTISIYRSMTLRSRVSSADFNLRMVALDLDRKLASIEDLRRWVRYEPSIITWLDNPGNTNCLLEAYDQLSKAFMANDGSAYITRLVVVDAQSQALLQVGLDLARSHSISTDNVGILLDMATTDNVFSSIQNDLFFKYDRIQMLPVVQPLYGFDSSSIKGYLYFEISGNLVAKALEGYALSPKDKLYLELGSSSYLIEDGVFIETAPINRHEVKLGDLSLQKHDHEYSVSVPFSPYDARLVQDVAIFGQGEVQSLLGLGFLVVLIIGAFCLLLNILLRKEVSEPVKLIQCKLNAIAQSDFSPDSSIEFDSELGDIGRGINELAGQVDKLIKASRDDERKRQDLEYKMLQYQINPHFLNNTLNSIRWMATLSHASGISEMVKALARLMEHVSKGDARCCTIAEELGLLEDYFTIQRYRYGDEISLAVDIDESLRGVNIPRFTFQPIVENAIFHGIEPKGGGGLITISGSRTDNGDCIFSIMDDGVGMSQAMVDELLEGQQKPRDGLFRSIGMANVNRRIVYMFGSSYGISIQSEVGNGTVVMIRLPVQKEGANGES